MRLTSPSPLASAAETRRRELPASVALVILTGGLAAAIMGGSGAVLWAALMALLLVADAEIYRRLDLADLPLTGAKIIVLSAWAFLTSAFYAVLPAVLWLDGEAAGAAAAMVLWVAGVVRHLNGGSGSIAIVAAGVTPPALSLLIAPLAMAAATARPDWDLAVIAAVGGGALMAYVAQARLGAAEAERNLRNAAATENLQHTLAQLLFDQATISAFLIDRDTRVLMMSNRVREGWQLSDVVGRRFEQICPWTPERWLDAHKRALAGEHVTCKEDEVATPHGRRWLEWEARPWRDASGEICGVLAFGRDITSLVEARREASANEDRLRVALDVGRSVVWEMDLKYETLRWCGDPRPIYGEEVTFADFNAAVLPQLADEDRAFVQSSFEAAIAGEVESFEHRMTMPDGSVGWVQVWARAVAGRSGETRKVIGLSKVITDRKQEEASFIAAMARAENAVRAKRALLTAPGTRPPEAPVVDPVLKVDIAEMFDRLDNLLDEMDARDALLAETLASLRTTRAAAENANISKSQFLASMSHELRTPLNAIIGYSEMLLEEAQAEARVSDQQDIERVLAAARQLLNLINDILDLSKIEAGRMDVAVSEFDIAHLVEEAASLVRPAMEKNANVVTVVLDGDLGEMQSDPFKLNQCLLNLLSNAGKFTRNGEIKICARRSGDWVEISVADSGIGMNEEQIGRLFQSFVQADASTMRKFGGTGLGLAITRRLMQLLGGDVSVTSALGAGSVFTLRLPRQHAAGVMHPKFERPEGQECGDRVALVIDDEESARDLVSRSLTRIGFTVHAAANGACGFDMAMSARPSIILLDINLPDISGWDVLARLQTAPETCAIPVIVHSVDDDRRRAMALGACEHLVKPADRDVLAAAVARIVRPIEISTAASITPPPSTLSKTA